METDYDSEHEYSPNLIEWPVAIRADEGRVGVLEFEPETVNPADATLITLAVNNIEALLDVAEAARRWRWPQVGEADAVLDLEAAVDRYEAGLSDD